MATRGTADVLVIGGGVIGLICAYELAGRGARVLVLERNGEFGREASWAAAGFLRHRITTEDAYGWLSRTSHARYPLLAEELHEQTGVNPEYSRCGGIEMALTPRKHASLRRFLAFQRSRGLRVEWLEPEEIADAEPALTREALGASYFPDDAQVRPPRLLKALAAGFRLRGGTMLTDTPVERLIWERTSVAADRRCIGARTADACFHADRTLLAAGPWSGVVAAREGLFLPVRPVRGQVLLLDAPKGTLTHTISAEGIYLVQRRDGTFLVGSTQEEVGFDKATTEEGIAQLKHGASQACPLLRDRPVLRAWAGLRPAPAHRFPYIGPMAEGLWMATAHFRLGILLAPATGQLVADGLLTGHTPVPLDQFDPMRDRKRVARDPDRYRIHDDAL